MRRFIPIVLFALALVVPVVATADSFGIVGSIREAYAGPAVGTLLTFCEYGEPEGFSLTTTVPPDGIVAFQIPYLPRSVAMDIEGDPVYEDVHLVIARPICPVSPCPPDQIAFFEVRLKRRLPFDDPHRVFPLRPAP